MVAGYLLVLVFLAGDECFLSAHQASAAGKYAEENNKAAETTHTSAVLGAVV